MVSIEAVWDRTSSFISDRSGDVVRIALPLVFLPMALLGIALPLVGPEPSVRNFMLGLITLALSLATLWGNLALTALVLEPGDWKAAARLGAGRLPAKILVSLIELVVLGVLIAPIFIAFAISGVVPGPLPVSGYPTMPLGAASFILIYTLVMIVVAVVLLARVLLVDAALVAERRGVSALPRSLRLTRGLTLKLVGVLLLYLIVSQVAALAARTVFGAILGMFTLGVQPPNVATVVTAILVAVVQTAFSVLAVVFAARLFVAVRDVRETIVELA